MKKVGIVPYLNELSRRYREVARSSTDLNARFALESISVEVANKANGLSEAFAVSERPRTAVGDISVSKE